MNQSLIGVILAQIGTPDAPSAKAVRPYLKRFLSDRRIIDYPPLLWQPLLRGIILRTRPRRSAKLYQEIWMEEGSPLLVHSRAQQNALQILLGSSYQVELGLAYSEPGMSEAFRKLEAAGITRIIVLPLFPQYSSTTTASVYEAASFAALGRHSRSGQVSKRFVPALRYVEAYHDAPDYIAAMRSLLLRQIRAMSEEPDYYVLSFHGIPRRYAETGDPYPQQCQETARLLAEAMKWPPERWQLSFQSRFGPETWVGPSTADTLKELSGRGIRRPLIFSPGLVTDCLETLHELAVEGRELFAAGGGAAENLEVAPCLNDTEEWISFLAGLISDTARGWLPSAVTEKTAVQPV
ncbi:ferrochelatase [Paenibacillus tritici]|uniref:Coproporphyrin III ferrochelatase n=1 Tax=Paenibacillus tritici TaxID=1873425 RepID=A0ABX2DMX7_9BACL|nr:ferrochelatase [Paenibacillus tritici]NQX45393.1 ferrochelatase [Paenibacillus tritici]